MSGIEIIPLSMHVDYWNRLGWTDPFSDPAYSDRQSEYARLFENDQVYTPQMIVDGTMEFVGSDRERALDAIEWAAKQSKVAVRLDVMIGASVDATGPDGVEIEISRPGDLQVQGTVTILALITESGLETHIRRGENAGLRLRNGAVVRSLEQIAKIDLAANPEFTHYYRPAIGELWNRDRLKVVILVQEIRSGQIVGAASTSFNQF